MKRLVLAFSFSLGAAAAGAQTLIKDTVSVGANSAGRVSYPDQVWYSLANDEQGRADRTEWDIAFDLKSSYSGVQVNHPAGVTIWKYPKNDLANGWASVDTAGLSKWTAHYNSDTSWDIGAIGVTADLNNSNLDWGVYNPASHIVTGDSLFIIKLADGAVKKFAIDKLSGGVYTFRYADLNGSNAQTATIDKADYTDRNFAYVSLSTNKIMDREPAAAKWDLLFTLYSTNLGVWSPVTGVLQNRGVKAVRVSRLNDLATNTNYSSQTFRSAINTLGYNWKSLSGGTYKVNDSELHFVRTASGDIWKVVFTGFGGVSTGNFIFSKQKLYSAVVPAGIGHIAAPFGLVVYPNPASGSDVQLIADLTGNTAAVHIDITDMSGRSVAQMAAGNISGLQRIVVPAAGLASGNYVVRLHSGIGVATQRLVIR
jgi:hypothetical protein